jgi:molybdopterin molybdotransferase
MAGGLNLIPVEEAQGRALRLASPLAGENVPLAKCSGRWLTDDIVAQRAQPWADLSAMDGYALRHADLTGPLAIIGESITGGPLPPPLAPGAACRIFTGAPLPLGADTVVIQEDTAIASDGRLTLAPEAGPQRMGQNVRPAGSDFSKGQVLLSRGQCLGPQHIALAAVGGYGALPVGGMPRIALISTGSELVAPGQAVRADQLPSSNAVMLETMLGRLSCRVDDFGIIPDDLDQLVAAFSRARGHDIIVTTGGASVGDHDLVRPAFMAAGGTLDFWKVAMRPGKPLMVGRIGDAILLGLPGNPVSAFTTALLFLLPIARRLAGSPVPLPALVDMTVTTGLPAGGDRQTYVRGHREGAVVTPLVDQDSAGLVALAQANCLIVRPSHAAPAPAGSTHPVLPLDY